MSSGWLISLGIWRAILLLPDAELPFNFTAEQQAGSLRMVIHNGDERLPVDGRIEGDTVVFRFPVFDSEIRAKVGRDRLEGSWINYARPTHNRIPFMAVFNDSSRFKPAGDTSSAPVDGRWDVRFSPGRADSSQAIGVFSGKGGRVYGTFLTPSGDYRYLEGVTSNDSLYLSCFDGSHAFLFMAKVQPGSMTGRFLSGSHWKEEWIAQRNDAAQLPHPDSLTVLRPGMETLDFSFPDADSVMIGLSDPAFHNKVKIIQVLGSWCPNCLDETAFLAEIYDRYPPEEFEIIGLAFEKTNDFRKAASNVTRLKERLHVRYPVLVAGSREEAKDKLSMVDRLRAYPTTFFLDRHNRVRKIHTGFSGPATGPAYEQFKRDFNAFVLLLLAEK